MKISNKITRWSSLGFAGFLVGAPLTTASVTLVADGEPRAAVILPAEPLADEQLAAEELVEHIALISGADLPVLLTDTPPQGLIPLRLGRAANPELDQASREAGDSPSSFTLLVDPEQIEIRGLSAEGTLFGAYELLEQLGIRWYLPGEIGRVLPKPSSRIEISRQTTVQAPTMVMRQLQDYTTYENWNRRVRLGGERRSTGSHGIPPFYRNQKLFAEHPQLFALRDGEHRFGQINPSHPEAVQATVQWIRENHEPTREKITLGMGPNDGFYNYCECENCKALDGEVFDPFCATTSVTGRYIWFFNQVLANLEDDYPNLHISWYVYATHMMPPPDGLIPNPRIVQVIAPITLDRVRGMNNPMSPDRHTLLWLLEQWSSYQPNEMAYRGYYNNLACPQFPISQVDRIRHEIPILREFGIEAMRVEAIQQSWASNTISLYLASRMMWDSNTDVDALLSEFYEKFYGPAAEPMGNYHEALESAFRDTPYFTGSSYLYFPIFHQDRRENLRGHLDQAANLATDNYRERVRIARLGFERLELFLDLIELRNQLDFAGAYSKMQEYLQLNDSMIDYILEGDTSRAPRLVHPWEHSTRSRSMFNRFFSLAIQSGHHRTVEAGELVAGLQDEWDFLLDPAKIGEISGWHRPGRLGGNWQPIKTTSRSWSDQGLHYYKGVAWYRQQVTIPDGFEGRPIYLWLGGVDNLAKVWLNGELLGTSREPQHGLPGVPGSFRPLDFLATEAIQLGTENTVTIKVTNDRLAELGTGGIVAPVMFWTPTDADWQP